MTSFFLAANYSLCCVALIVLRHREPDLPRLYRAWGYPWSVWLVAAGGMIFLVGMLVGDMLNGLAALALLGVGILGRVPVQVENYSLVNSGGATWQALMILDAIKFPTRIERKLVSDPRAIFRRRSSSSPTVAASLVKNVCADFGRRMRMSRRASLT